MTEPIYDYDPAQALDGPEAIAVFIADALDTGDAAYIAKAMGVVARAKGMTELAAKAGLSRESLYRALSEDGNPRLDTLMKVLGALGVKLTLAPVDAAE